LKCNGLLKLVLSNLSYEPADIGHHIGQQYLCLINQVPDNEELIGYAALIHNSVLGDDGDVDRAMGNVMPCE
jgi:hypothetical protein